MKQILLLLTIFVFLLIPCFAQVNGASSSANSPDVLFPIVEKYLWGFINIKGEIIILPQYSNAGYFSEGLAPVCTREKKKCGYINTKGEVVIPFQFESAESFSNGMAQITENSKVGFIDKTGKVIIKPQFIEVDEFYEGLALVRVDSYDKWGYINKKGEVVIKPQFKIAWEFSEGVAAVQKGEKFGFIDKTGKFFIKPKFYNAGSFSEGLAPVMLTEDSDWSLIDKTGKLVMGGKTFDTHPNSFINGLAIIGVKCINKQGVEVDKSGCNEFSEGLTPIRDANGKAGFMDESGKIVITPQWDLVNDFKDGAAIWYKRTKDGRECSLRMPGGESRFHFCGKWGYMDKTGKEIWESENNY